MVAPLTTKEGNGWSPDS